MPAPPKTQRGPPWRCDLAARTVAHRDSGLIVHIMPVPPPADERERLRELTARGLSVRHRFADASGPAWVAWQTSDADRAMITLAPTLAGGLAQAARVVDRIAADAARAWRFAQGKAAADAARHTGAAPPGNPARDVVVTTFRPHKAPP